MKRKLFLISSLAFTLNVFAQVPSYVPTTGLVGWWSFTGNANDLSGNNNNGTVNGATLVADRNGNANSAYSFNGTNSYIDVPNSASLAFSSNVISISFWAKVNSVNSSGFNNIMISKQAGSGNTQQGFDVAESTTQSIYLAVSNGGGNFGGPSVTSVPLSQWHHFIYVYNNGTSTSYYDGVQVANTTGQTATIGANTLDLLFGQANWSNINAINYDGILDDMGIWDRALTQTEVTQIYSSNMIACTADITTGLIAKFDFNGNANDLSTNGNNATVSGATLVADRFGNANNAYSFNGSSDYIEIPNSTAYNNQLYTLSFWAKTSAPSSSGSGGFDVNPALISKLSPSTTVTYDNWVFYEGNGTPGFACYSTSGLGGPVFNDNNWHNIVTTVNTDSVRFYFDGALVGKVVRGTNLIFNTQPIRIGRSIATYWKAYDGTIDDFRIYNRAISSCDVDSLYNIPNPSTVGIADINNALEFSITPNPFSEQTTISFSTEQKNTDVKILDVFGKEIKTISFSGKQLSIEKREMQAGIYFVQITDKNKNITNKKIIIQ